MFSKLSILSLIFVAAVSVNGMSFDDYLMERELSSDMLDTREPVYAEIRESMEPTFAEIREALEFLGMDAREPAPAPHNHKKNQMHQPKKHNHKHTKVIVEKVIVEKQKPQQHNHNHQHNNNNGGNKVVLIKEAPVTKTITVNGAKHTVIQQVGGPTITLAPQGTVTVYRGKTYTVAKAKPTSINRLKTLGKKIKNSGQAPSAVSSMKVYTLLGALTAVGALFA